MSGTSKRLLFSTKGFSVCGNKCWKIMLHLTDQQFFYNFFIIFEKVFKMLTGRNLVTEYLSSVCLFKGETHAILALPGSITLLKLSLIAMANGFLKKIGDGITSFGGILPLDFLLSIFLKSVLHTSRNLGGCLQLWAFFLCYFSFQWTGFYMITAFVMKELNIVCFCMITFTSNLATFIFFVLAK